MISLVPLLRVKTLKGTNFMMHRHMLATLFWRSVFVTRAFIAASVAMLAAPATWRPSLVRASVRLLFHQHGCEFRLETFGVYH